MIEKRNRQKERLIAKIMWGTFLIVLWFFLIYFDYNFNNLLGNGLVLMVTSFFLFSTLYSDRYYIETSFRENAKETQAEYQEFCFKHQGYVIYNKVVVYSFVFGMILSLSFIVAGLIQ